MNHGTLDPGYVSDLTPCLAGHTTRRPKLQPGKDKETSSWTLHLQVIRPEGTVYWREAIPRHISRKTAEATATKIISLRLSRMRQLIKSTPGIPPERKILIARQVRGIATLQELQAMAMAAWQRRYICLTPSRER